MRCHIPYPLRRGIRNVFVVGVLSAVAGFCIPFGMALAAAVLS